MSLNDFLVYLVGGGAIVVVSWLLEQFQWFNNLAAKSKQLVFFSCSLVVALAAYAVQTYVPALVLAQLAPYFTIIAATFTAIFLGSTFHAVTKLPTAPDVPPPNTSLVALSVSSVTDPHAGAGSPLAV